MAESLDHLSEQELYAARSAARRDLISAIGIDTATLPNPIRAAIEALAGEVLNLREDLARSRDELEKAAALAAGHHARLASWISERSPMCKHITAKQIDGLLASKLVTQAQVQAAGLRS